MDITPLFELLGIMLLTILIVYAAASFYYARKNAQWEASFEAMEATPPTEAEQAIGDEWQQVDAADILPPSMGVDEVAPPPLPKAANWCDFHNRARCIEKPDDFPPSYKLDCQPIFKQRNHIGTPIAERMPQGSKLSGAMYAAAIDTEAMSTGLQGFLGVSNDGPCEICARFDGHDHTAVEVRAYVQMCARASFDKYVADMDLAALKPEALDILWLRCKARIEENAILATLQHYERVWVKAKQIVQEEDADEQFYQLTLAEAAKGPKVIVPPSGAIHTGHLSAAPIVETYDQILERVEKKSKRKTRRSKPRKK